MEAEKMYAAHLDRANREAHAAYRHLVKLRKALDRAGLDTEAVSAALIAVDEAGALTQRL